MKNTSYPLNNTYNITPLCLTKTELNKISTLLNYVFNSELFTTDYLSWLYNENPSGKAVGYNAYLNKELVAHYATIPVEYIFSNKKYAGLLSLNTATSPQHKGKGLFTKLASKTYITASDNGFDFIIGVANQNSTDAFIKKLGFELISSLKVNLGIGPIKQQTTHKEHLKRNWNNNTLTWRLKNPNKNYFTYKKQLSSKSNYPLINVLLHSNINNQYNLPREKSRVQITMGHNINSKHLLSIPIPTKLRPSPLNLIFKPLNKEIHQLKDKIQLYPLDFDAY